MESQHGIDRNYFFHSTKFQKYLGEIYAARSGDYRTDFIADLVFLKRNWRYKLLYWQETEAKIH